MDERPGQPPHERDGTAPQQPGQPETYWAEHPPSAQTADFSAARPTPAGQPPAGQDVVVSQPPVRRRGRRALAGAALAAGLAVGGAGVAAAVGNAAGTTDTPSTPSAGQPSAGQPSTPPSAPGDDDAARPGHRGGPGPRGMRPGLTGGALHGELTVPQTDGTGTRVVLVQRGEVTAVSSTRLSLKSTDGFTATYPVTSSTRVHVGGVTTAAELTVGTTVNVVAEQGGSALLVAGGKGGGMRGMGHGDRGRPDGDGPGPGATAPDPSAPGATTPDPTTPDPTTPDPTSPSPTSPATGTGATGTALTGDGVAADL